MQQAPFIFCAYSLLSCSNLNVLALYVQSHSRVDAHIEIRD